MSVRHYPARPIETEPGETPCTAIIPPDPRGWDTIAVHEWELSRTEWTDRHPFDETNYVLAGVLHVESDGQVVVAAAGDTVTVTAGPVVALRYPVPAHRWTSSGFPAAVAALRSPLVRWWSAG